MFIDRYLAHFFWTDDTYTFVKRIKLDKRFCYFNKHKEKKRIIE